MEGIGLPAERYALGLGGRAPDLRRGTGRSSG
jgi:hypothetical protein